MPLKARELPPDDPAVSAIMNEIGKVTPTQPPIAVVEITVSQNPLTSARIKMTEIISRGISRLAGRGRESTPKS